MLRVASRLGIDTEFERSRMPLQREPDFLTAVALPPLETSFLDHALEAVFPGVLLNCRQRIQGNRVARLEGVTVYEVVSVCKHRPSSVANSYENL